MDNRIETMYIEHAGYIDGLTKYGFICELFDLATYDDDVSERWGRAIIEVMRAIDKQETFEYIKESDDQYERYLIVANLLEHHQLIDWGGSIRGAWFDLGKDKIIHNEDEMKYLLYEFIEE